MTPFRLARREIRHRPVHAALFALSVALGSGVLLGLSGFNAAVETGVKQQARELWAADITVEGTPGLLDDIDRWAADRWPGLRAARTVDTVSMVRAARGDAVTQATLSGLSPGYPLYGQITTGSGRPLALALEAGAVASPKILAQLGLSVGDEAILGRRRVRIADTLASRTDAPASFFEFAPSLLLPLKTLERTGLLGPGSRSLNKFRNQRLDGIESLQIHESSRINWRFGRCWWELWTAQAHLGLGCIDRGGREQHLGRGLDRRQRCA